MQSFLFINLLIVLGFVSRATKGQQSGDLRLVSGSGTTGGSSGRLEVYYSGQWGTVCSDNFGADDARVACRQLGFSIYFRYGRVGLSGSQASSSTPTWLDNLHCSGSESRLIDCLVDMPRVEDYNHSDDVLLSCTGFQSSGNLRLITSSGSGGFSIGRLEVYYNGQWGTVCSDSFDGNDAKVACRQLGFTTYSQFGTVGRLRLRQASSSTQTWLDNLQCSGSESKLVNCPANPIGVENCDHFQDVALYCREGSSLLPTALIAAIVASAAVGVLIFSLICIVSVCVVFKVRRQRAEVVSYRQFQADTTMKPVSTAMVVAQNSATANTQATAHPLQHSANPPPYPSGPRQPAASYPAGQPPYSSGARAPQAKGDLSKSWNLEFYSDPPPAYPVLDYSTSTLSLIAVDTASTYCV